MPKSMLPSRTRRSISSFDQHFRVEHVGGKPLDDASRQVPQGSGRTGADAQGAGTALRLIDGVLEQLYLAQDASGVRDGHAPCLVETDAVLLPIEELGAEFCLESLNRSAESRLREVARVGGGRHGAVLRERLELPKLVDIHKYHLAFHA